MTIPNLEFLLALGDQPQPGQQPPPIWTSLVPLALIGVVFYFILFRPQQKRAKDHANLIKAIKAGDKVVTSSGIVGVVVAVKERTVSLRSADSKFEVLKSAVAEISERGGESSES